MQPLVCPICTRWELRPVFQEITIQLQVGGEEKSVAGVLGYQCMQYGHIFFVRQADIETEVLRS